MGIRSVGPDVKVVDMIKRIDALTSVEVGKTLDEALTGDVMKVICNFAQTAYIASAGIRVLMAAAKQMQQRGGMLCACCPNTAVQSIFAVTNLSLIIEVFGTEAEAISK